MCCNLIQGIQRLKYLGQMLWDFDKIHMEFHLQGIKFVLKCAKVPSLKLINSKSFAHDVKMSVELCLCSH